MMMRMNLEDRLARNPDERGPDGWGSAPESGPDGELIQDGRGLYVEGHMMIVQLQRGPDGEFSG